MTTISRQILVFVSCQICICDDACLLNAVNHALKQYKGIQIRKYFVEEQILGRKLVEVQRRVIARAVSLL